LIDLKLINKINNHSLNCMAKSQLMRIDGNQRKLTAILSPNLSPNSV